MKYYRGNYKICANCDKCDKNVCKHRLSKSYKNIVMWSDSCAWWKQKKIETLTANEIYRRIVKVTNSDERGHWCSDLYCKVKPETSKILEKYQFKNQVSHFTDRITGKLWYCIPFAYNPYWEEKTHVDV